MSTIISSCTGNGSTHNPVSNLSNRFFQEASISAASSSRTLLSNIEQGRRNTTNSFRSSTSTPGRGWTEVDNGEWNNLFQPSVVHGSNQYSKEFTSFFMSEEDKEEEEEFRQEWSDEHFTEIYIKQNGLDKLHNNIRTRRHSYSSSQTNSFVQEFLQNSNDTTNHHRKITTVYTNHCDLFQAQIYLLDHLFSTILTYPITPTYRPSPTAEWNWARLFSPTRWCDKDDDDDDDKILQNEFLKNVAIGRLQLLLGHLIVNTDNDNNQNNKQKETSGWE